MAKIEYFTNLKTADDPARERAYRKMMKHFGYLPVYGPTMADVTYGQNLLDHIIRAYPDYRWVIEVRDGVVTCVNESLAPDWGFRLRTKKIDNDGVVIKQFAGRLLEMYGLEAAGMNPVDVLAKPRDLRGNILRVN